jgi:hypothetical protein
MKINESEQISWINNQPIPKGEPSDSVLIGWMIGIFVISGVLFAIFGGDRRD